MILTKFLIENLRNKKILVTGHTGFKGSWLVKILSRYTSHICGFSLLPQYEDSLYSICGIQNHLEFEYIDRDISTYSNIEECIKTFKPDVIFHLAAQPLVIDSYERPLYTFNSNTIGTLNVLEAVRKHLDHCSIVCITTDKVYENSENGIPFVETDKLGGYDPYSASKAACEIVIDSYRKSFFNPNDFGIKHNVQLASCRAGNVIGGGDFSKNRIMVDIARALACNEKISIRNPVSTRPWQHVLEPLAGYIEIAARMESGFDRKLNSAWNFGPENGSEKTVECIARKAIECWGSGAYEIQKNENAVHEAGLLQLNISKAKQNLEWKPRFDVDDAVKMTIEWYKAYFNNEDCNKIVEEQIASIMQYYKN